MFPYTHICFAKDVLGEINSDIVLGSVFPDTVISGFLEHADTHQRCGEIHNYLHRLGIFTDFADAVITHGTSPEGLDYYCDESYSGFQKGYAFEAARPLIDKVVQCCRLPEEMGWWKAHNFIEMAAELWFYQHRNEDYGLLAKALDNEELILALSQILAPFYDIPVAKLAMSFPIYGEYVLMDSVTSHGLAQLYAKQTAKKHGIYIDVPGAANVIDEALEIVGDTLPEFMTTCNKNITGLIKKLNNY